MSVLPCSNVTSSSEIRRIPIGILTRLSSILETNNAWKVLMGVIPDFPGSGSLKYTSEHVKLIEDEAKRSGRAQFSILVDEWGSSGKNRPKIGDLIHLLQQVELFQAADYLCECVGIDSFPRPTEGPAASISYGDMDLLQSTDDLSNRTILHEAMNEELNQNYCSNSTIFPATFPTLGQFNTNLPHLDYSLLESITNNFNSDPIARQGRLLGSGGFGAVFLGMLPSSSFSNPDLNKFQVQQIFDKFKIPLLSKLAVKKLKSQQLDFSDVDMKNLLFRREVEIMSGYVHENLLTLLAYSANGPDCCLVYPYMPNGSLEARLACEGGSDPIQWNIRLNAANGVASALIYLHRMEVVHRDVKSANILLDNDMKPKLGDFGLIRICSGGKSGMERMTSTILGTPAFMAPEAFRGDMWCGLDTFSFGVVMLELLVGLPSIDETRDDPILIYHIETALEEKEFIELLDPRIPPLPERMANRLHSIANSCLQEKKKRPTMEQVYEDLLQVGQTE